MSSAETEGLGIKIRGGGELAEMGIMGGKQLIVKIRGMELEESARPSKTETFPLF